MISSRTRRGLTVALPFFVLMLVPALARADGEGESIYKNLLRSTAWVIVPQTAGLPQIRPGQTVRVPLATGSGSLIDEKQKLLLTNYHVVGEMSQAFVLFPTLEKGKPIANRDAYLQKLNRKEAIRARVKVRDPRRDLALLELEMIPAGAKAIPLARESAGPGQRVHSIGNPGASGALWVYTSGTVRTAPYKRSWMVRAGRGRPLELDSFVIETQSPTNPGDSGGPLANDYGELVAVTQGGIQEAQQVSIFVDVQEVADLLRSAKIRPNYAARRSREKATASANAEGTTAKKNVETEQQKNERLAAAKLRYAKIFIRDKELESAKAYCEQILTDYPMTKAAVEAKALMQQLNSRK